ncbi:SDR family oxidoreductase [Nocardia sp. NEAU-G5]|uniref:3-oxoacyl-[acyl-carrier-protein] reductase MabA n=1 Tax=Nocardia albiluteola TaxID=2842303 RepID=A0ABS6AYD7_9NOCA|nr:SDR family oxidoreductase [Nocardia albiluteola]MBU3063066.1 SDR family oxidoreductase [Nocardia albiluteola]
MDLGIDGRTAIVLASTAGLGAATAAALAAEGANVVVTGRDPSSTRQVAQALKAAIGVDCDLTEPGTAERILDATRETYGEPDILVLNGPGPSPGTAAALDAAGARTAIDALLATHIELVNLVLPGMRARRWGRIVAIGSSGVEAPLPMLAASNLGRAALAAYLKTLAAEVAADGVTVNMVLPGRIGTDRVASLDAAAARRTGTSVDAVRTASQAKIPIGRYGEPHEFGAVAAFLCGAPASYVTGSMIRCDGGLLANL